MSEDVFQTASRKAQARDLPLSALVGTATELAAAGKSNKARELYETWIAANGDDPQLHIVLFNCSALATDQGDSAYAETLLRQTLARDPNFLPAHINLGGLLERAGAIDAAVAQWREAVGKPLPVTGNSVLYVTTALKQITRVLAEHHQVEAAEFATRLCLDVDPNQRDAVEQLTALRLTQCRWPATEPLERLGRDAIVRQIHPLSMAAYTDDPLLQLGVADNFSKVQPYARPANFASDRRHASIDLTGRRLRVGYISSDLRDHAIGYLMAELFEVHDRSRVEIFAYYCGPDSTSDLYNRISKSVEHWSPINKMNDDEAAAKIAADGIDILVDVNGHTRDARTGVFARRPAPKPACPRMHSSIAASTVPTRSRVSISCAGSRFSGGCRTRCYGCLPDRKKPRNACAVSRKPMALPANASSLPPKWPIRTILPATGWPMFFSIPPPMAHTPRLRTRSGWGF